jgi:argininosuccinate lyase
MSKLWGGRFEGKTDALVEALGESVSYDARLAPWDIRASIAHAEMLGTAALSPRRTRIKIVKGLKAIAKDVEAGKMTWDTALGGRPYQYRGCAGGADWRCGQAPPHRPQPQ